MRSSAVCKVIALTVMGVLTVVHTQSNGEYVLTLLHLNDFHARFEETNILSGRCSPEDSAANRCYGGIAR